MNEFETYIEEEFLPAQRFFDDHEKYSHLAELLKHGAEKCFECRLIDNQIDFSYLTEICNNDIYEYLNENKIDRDSISNHDINHICRKLFYEACEVVLKQHGDCEYD